MAIKNIESPSFVINFVASNMNISLIEKQGLLEEVDLKIRANNALGFLTKELQMLEMKNEIQSKVRTDLDKQQREYFLHQQMKAIQEELGGAGSGQEVEEMRTRAKEKKWNKEVAESFEKDLQKLQRMNPGMADYSVHRSYLELVLDLPWDEFSEDKFDLRKARKILDRDHFGLEKVKERIIEFLAVLKLKGDMKSPILCLSGPPGVGKTSLGKSVAEALGRKYVRVSLGGLRDEAEIRGHRRTYIGAMPGRIIKSIKKAETSNPVFVLDEIDKVTRDMHGDPSSALLEVLDPEQNESFHDNYLELGYDLSKVLFIATANSLNTIQPALLDRMEIIEMSGYTVEEKVSIAKKHLLPKQLKEHGLTKKDLLLSDKALEKIVDGYTRESGVRGLEKTISKVIRYAAKCIAMDQDYKTEVSVPDLEKILGPVKFDRDRLLNNDVAGVATGLAWTRVGGDILFIESSLSKGKGILTITGNLGNVMKESATIALEYLKAHAKDYEIDPNIFQKWNVHIHVPEGATPKDGPSAGITMFSALASIFTNRKVNNKEFHVIVDKDVYWGLSWYLRGFENIQYEDFSYIEVALDGSPIQSPESSVLILSEYNEGNLFARLGNYDEGERFNYLWWPPEEYKPCKTNQNDGCVTPGKIVKNVATFEKWKELFKYMMYRKTEAKFLHHDAIFYTGIGDKE